MDSPPLPDEEDDLRNWRKELARLWTRVWVALNKAAALGVAILIHKGLEAAAKWIVPEGWNISLTLLEAIFFVVFSIVYIHFLWEMLAVFVPFLKRKRSRNNNAVHKENP